ncbi:hypothetical protein ABVF11_02025 [Pediococcus argentinicus]|uniref:hypothetical protein n=1 Tax=Pediococcus argentinicus TaxID=480391 RepID=UPI00338D9C8A
MNEYDNVREALKEAIEMSEATNITTVDNGNNKPATIEDVQESIRERLYSIADLLGMSDLYTGGKD